jgi:hypothetical protein
LPKQRVFGDETGTTAHDVGGQRPDDICPQDDPGIRQSAPLHV